MSVNVAFYDEKNQVLVNHEQLNMARQSASMVAIQLGILWQSGRHRIPARYWVVWENLDDLGVFPLDQVDAEDFVMPPVEVLDRIEACVQQIRSFN